MVERMVSHYRIIDKVGEGGMGVVYRAHDTLLQRTVALKFISSARLSSEKSREHFYREARAAAALEHENICSIHEIAESDGATFIVMAFCEGPTLRDMINNAPLSLDKAVPVIKDVAQGLGCAHEKGIVHRDIKPSNIIVDPGRGRARIMDFGLAKTLGPGDEGTSTTRAGTIEYVSPEQIENGVVDGRTDIWSLGVTFLETITGKRPFGGQYQASVIYSILNEDPDMSGIPTGPEGELATDIIARSLSKDPDERYADIDSFIRDLERLERMFSSTGETRQPGRQKNRLPWYRARPLFILTILAISLPVLLWFDSLDDNRLSQDGIPAVSSNDSLRSEADMMFERGKNIYDSGDHATGITLIEEVASIDPDHMMALKTLATYYSESGESERAAPLIERAKKIAIRSGTPIDLLKCNIVEAFVWHDWEMAIRYLEGLLEEEPGDPRIHINIGFVYSRHIGDFKRAIEHLEKALSMDPDDRQGLHRVAWNYLGSAWLYLGRYDEALNAIDKYRMLTPDSPDPGLTLGVACLFSGQYARAIGLMEDTINRGAHSFKYFEVLGRSLLYSGRWQKAVDAFNRYIGAADSRGFKATGHLHLAKLYMIQNDRDYLDSEINSLLAIEPESPGAIWIQGVAALRLDNDLVSAQRYLDTLKEIIERPFVFDGECYSYHLEGLIHLANGESEFAFDKLEAAEKASTRDFYYFGTETLAAAIKTGDMERAARKKEMLESYNPNDPALLVNLCELSSISGDRVKMEEYKRRYLELMRDADPGFSPLVSFISKYGS